jgi:hypothetical protein
MLTSLRMLSQTGLATPRPHARTNSCPRANGALNLGQLGLQRELGNLGTLDLDVTVGDLVQLNRGRRLFILRQARPAANTLGKRTCTIDMALFDQGSFSVPGDVGHVLILTRRSAFRTL